MNLFLFLVWLQMSAQPQTRVTMYESMCRMPNLEYGERYKVFSATDWLRGTRECHIFERNVGEVYWRGPHGEAILFPIGSPLDDITRAEFAESAQRAADETDGKPPDYHLDRWYWYDPSIEPHEPWTDPGADQGHWYGAKCARSLLALAVDQDDGRYTRRCRPLRNLRADGGEPANPRSETKNLTTEPCPWLGRAPVVPKIEDVADRRKERFGATKEAP